MGDIDKSEPPLSGVQGANAAPATGGAGKRGLSTKLLASVAAAVIVVLLVAGVMLFSNNDPAPAKSAAPAAGSNFTVPDYKIEMIWIAPGSFNMGDGSDAHRVTLTRGYWLGKYEVTQGQWQAVMGNNPSYFPQAGANAPVEQVSWTDAQEFCKKLTERERAAGSLPAGYEYTLPTEAQWEYACRAGTTGEYGGNGSLVSMGWYSDNSGSTTHPVGQKQPNAWGLYDMHGNVWEWCADWYGDYPDGSVTDPAGASSGSHRVGRGGCWLLNAGNCRSAYRGDITPAHHYNILGFRFALSSVH